MKPFKLDFEYDGVRRSRSIANFHRSVAIRVVITEYKPNVEVSLPMHGTWFLPVGRQVTETAGQSDLQREKANCVFNSWSRFASSSQAHIIHKQPINTAKEG
jgi:hypothetical protein